MKSRRTKCLSAMQNVVRPFELLLLTMATVTALSPPAGAVAQNGLSTGGSERQLESSTEPVLSTGKMMDARTEPLLDLETVRNLAPPELMARLSGPPKWTGQSHDERTAHLLQHVGKHTDITSKRRTQWQWEGSGTQARDDSLAAIAVAAANGDGSGLLGCTDPLASNAGAVEASCAYDCTTLQQELFPGLPSRCFIYDTSTQTWPAELLGRRQQRLETHAFVDQGAGTNLAPGAALVFTVGTGRSCRNVTIASTMMDTEITHTEVVCLVDGEHEYNHTLTAAHSVDVIGYTESGVHAGAGGTTSFVVGECTDALIRVTTSASGSPTTWSLNDGGHNGPWTFESAGGAGVHEHVTCMFDNEYTLTRQGPASSWQGSVEVVGFIDYHNTITIPNSENWIVQGNVDPATGLPVLLDARLSSGSPLDRSHANIALRYVRLSGQVAPVDPDPQSVGRGTWFPGEGGSYGGAFRYEGGSSDHANPVQLIFDHAIFDHNSATVGGAVFINGRAGYDLPDSTAQNWDSGIAARWESCVFFRNFAFVYMGGLEVANVWPMTFTWESSAFIQNSAANECAHEGYHWDNLGGMGPDKRAGFTSLVHTGTLYDGGFSTEGLLSSVMVLTGFVVDGASPDEPDATWNVTLTGVTYQDHATFLVPSKFFAVYPILPANSFELNIHVTDLTVTDDVALISHPFDAIYLHYWGNAGTSFVARACFERNGRFSADAAGIGGTCLGGTSAVKEGLPRYRSTFVDSEWTGNQAGTGAALYVAGQHDVQVDRCIFRDNIATQGGGAIYFGATYNTQLLIERSFFEMNAVRPLPTVPAAATVVLFTDQMGEGNPNRPIWRIDDGPVHGIGWDLCQAVMQRSQQSVQQGFPPWIPTESQLPSSCANESYHVATTYASAEMLTPGDHTLWHGVVATTANIATSSGWIKIDDVTPPIFPSITDDRGVRYPGCSQAPSCEVTTCCPSHEVFWSSTPFRVSTGRGGAVAASGSNHITIRDSVFRANEAPRGATLRISSTLSARIANTSIDEPPDEWSSAVSALGASVATCFDNPCGTGSRCTFRDHSTICEACGPNEIGTDGISCYACPPGTQPDALQAQCMPCASGQYSTIGVCTQCGDGKTSTEDRTGCKACPVNQMARPPEFRCQCQLGYYNSTDVRPACNEGDFVPEAPQESSEVCISCGKLSCIKECQGDWLQIESGWSSHSQASVSDAELPVLKCRYDVPGKPSSCPGGVVANNNGTACAEGYEDPLCGACMDGFILKSDGECELCGKTATSSVVIVVVGGLALLVVTVKYVPVWFKALKLASDSIQDLARLAQELDLKAISKIFLGTMQILGNLTAVLAIALPETFAQFIKGFVMIFKFDLVNVFALGCLSSGSYTSSLIAAVGLVVSVAMIVGCVYFYEMAAVEKMERHTDSAETVTAFRELFDQFDADNSQLIDLEEVKKIVVKIDPTTTTEETETLYKMANTDDSDVGISFDEFLAAATAEHETEQDTVRLDLGLLVKKKAQYNIRDNTTSRLFLLVFLLYPSLTNTILEGFACRKIGENEAVLHVDYTMACDDSSESWALFLVNIVLTLLWPIGVPGFLFYTMYMVRAAIMDDDPDTLQKYNFVLNDYDKEHWYWEIVELLRKLILAGLIGLVGRGSVLQTVAATLISFVFFALTFREMPYNTRSLNAVKLFSDFQLFGVLLVCVVLQTERSNQLAGEALQRPGYGICQLALTVAIVPITLYVLYTNALEIREHTREQLAILESQQESENTTSDAELASTDQEKPASFDEETANPMVEKGTRWCVHCVR